MHFKETLAFSLPTAPAPVSSMLTSCSTSEQGRNAPAGAAEYAPVWLFNQFLAIKILSAPKI